MAGRPVSVRSRGLAFGSAESAESAAGGTRRECSPFLIPRVTTSALGAAVPYPARCPGIAPSHPRASNNSRRSAQVRTSCGADLGSARLERPTSGRRGEGPHCALRAAYLAGGVRRGAAQPRRIGFAGRRRENGGGGGGLL